MHTDKLLGKIDYSIDQNGIVIINSKQLNIRDVCFLTYYLIRKGDLQQAETLINGIAANTQCENRQYCNIALWLWIVGEYTNAAKDETLIRNYSATICECIDYLERNWCTPRENWLGMLEDDVHISNIAMAFGAVQSISNCMQNNEAQRLKKVLNEFLFGNYMVRGQIVSGLANKEVMGDISIIAVPFALIDAGNQNLVESINTLENELVDQGVRFLQRDSFYGGCVRPDLTCLLSWYYSERGDVARAKSLLSKANESWIKHGELYNVDPETTREQTLFEYYVVNRPNGICECNLAYILYAIADQNIALKERTDLNTNSVKINHNPEGTGNKYLVETMQRIPVNPLENETVLLRAEVQPLSMAQKVFVEYTISGLEKKDIDMKLETSEEAEQFYQASLGQFMFGDNVEYRFVVETINQETVYSDYFQFTARRWIPLRNVLCAAHDSNTLVLSFGQLTENGKYPSLRITEKNEGLNLSFYMDDIIANDTQERIDQSFRLERNDIHIQQKEGSITFRVNEDGVIQSYKKLSKHFAEVLTDGSGKIYKVRYNFELDDQERLYGMGERYSRIEYRGYDIDNYVYNEYTNQKLRTYIPVPFTISSKGYGIFLDTTMYSMFRFGTRVTDLLEIEADIHREKQTLEAYMFIGSPKEVVQSFAGVTGKPTLPPKWAFGPWMSSHNWDSQQETLKQVALTKKYQIPATVLVLEQWSDEATFYAFNDATYPLIDGNDRFKYDDFTFPEWGRWPSPKEMVKEIHNDNMKVFLWQPPVQKYMDGIAHAQRDEDERVMLENKYFVKHRDGKPYRVPTYEWFKRSLVPDFSNPKARQWWLSKRRYLLEEVGIDGFKPDGGECMFGDNLVYYDGRTGEEIHNQHANEYIRSFHEFANEYVEGGTVTFSRAGYTGAQAIPLHWAGDEWSTFEAYRSSINAGLSCSMSGIPFWGWDIAGFHGKIPSAELYIRSTQFAAFCPVMQYHAETKGELNRDRTPWNIAERTQNPLVLENYKKYADLRMNILPYIYDQAKQTSNTGIPLMRAMFLEYPNDQSCANLTDQYLFGDSLLVAPVTQENSSTKDVYLPKGRWIELLEDDELTGCTLVCVKSDIAKIPVYIREDSVIPLNLGDSLTLCSHVGNQVIGYTNLCFMLYLTQTIKYDFTDEIGNCVNIAASKTQEEYEIDISSNCKQPITIIFRMPDLNVNAVLKNKIRLKECNDESVLDVESYVKRNQELLLRIDSDAKLKIEF